MKNISIVMIMFFSFQAFSEKSTKEDLKNIQIIELRNDKYFPISKCLAPDLGRFRFDEISFISGQYIKNDDMGLNDKCSSNLLHQINVSEISLEESEKNIKKILNKKTEVFEFSDNWFKLFVSDDPNNNNDSSFQIFIPYLEDEYVVEIRGWTQSYEFAKIHEQTCKALSRFLNLNNSIKVLSDLNNSDFCQK